MSEPNESLEYWRRKSYDLASERCRDSIEILELTKQLTTLKAQRDELLAALKESTEQLDAMNQSASHAVSWVRPRSESTDIQITKNRAAIANAEKGA